MRENPASIPKQPCLSIVNGCVIMGVLALGLAAYFTPLKTWLAHGEQIKAQLETLGFVAPLVFTFFAGLLTVVGVPRLLLCSLGGLVFGFAWGLVWTQLATLLGSYAIFLIVRWRGRCYTLNRYPRLRGFSQHLEKQSWLSVVLIRQLPLGGFYNTVFLGLTPVGHRDFVLGSLLGFLPLSLTACLLGAGLIQADWLAGMRYFSGALACSVILGLALNRLAKRKNQPEAAADDPSSRFNHLH